MNLFIVPSWYPSTSNPSYGIFVKEQVAMLAKERPHWNLGVSTWGQGDIQKLLWIKDHIKNFKKLQEHGLDKAGVIKQGGFTEYYQPALTWTKRFKKGNLKEIIRCNELNFQAYTLENGKPDVLMVQACYPGILIAEYLSAKYEVPVYLHVRLGGFMFENMLHDLGSMEKDLLAAVSKAKWITTTSNFQAKELKRWIFNPFTLYNPVNLDHFQLHDENDGYAVTIGRFENEKGFDLLLKAINKVPDLKVKIVGSGSEKEGLQKMIISLGLSDRVSILSEADRSEVKEYIQKSSFLILPSRYETFGNVLLEAMACGKPVVATRCGGPEEIITPTSGYLCEANADDLGEKISMMVKNFYSFDSVAIRKTVEDNFSPSNWINQLEKLLKET